jgi:hypothetical protein
MMQNESVRSVLLIILACAFGCAPAEGQGGEVGGSLAGPSVDGPGLAPLGDGPATVPAGTGAVLLQEIHLERGMHCIDCHFLQDNHGDGNLYPPFAPTPGGPAAPAFGADSAAPDAMLTEIPSSQCEYCHAFVSP